MTRFRKKTFMEDRRSVRLRRFFWLLGIALLFPQKQMHQTHEDYRVRGKVILQPQGKEFFTCRGKNFFTSCGKEFFT